MSQSNYTPRRRINTPETTEKLKELARDLSQEEAAILEAVTRKVTIIRWMGEAGAHELLYQLAYYLRGRGIGERELGIYLKRRER